MFKYLHDLQNNLKPKLASLVNRGKLVCNEFEPKETIYCAKCGYSEYWHLVKQVLALEE